MKKRTLVSLALSLLMGSSSVAWAAGPGDGGTATPPATDAKSQTGSDSEAWPWMTEEKPQTAEPAPAGEAAKNTAVGSSESREAQELRERESKDRERETLKRETPEAAKPKTNQALLKREAPEMAVPTKTARVEVPRVTAVMSSIPRQPTKLFGRIEELAGSTTAKFPELKPMTARLDARGSVQRPPLAATARTYSGQVVSSFPLDFNGTWGGTLRLQQMQESPSYWQIDPDEASHTRQVMRIGMDGSANFTFKNFGSRVSLEPTSVMFMVPASQTLSGQVAAQQASRMLGGAGGMGQMMQQMMGNMNVPILLNFGEIDTASDPMLRGLSGNSMRSTVLKNDIRQLSANVLEQQIVTSETSWNKNTGQPRSGYGESVIRFTGYNANQMFVQAASVSYGSDRRFLYKVILAGYITRGQVMQTDPYAASMGGMPNLGGAGGGAGGLGGLGGMFGLPGGNQGGGGGQAPNMNQIQDMMKQLMGQ